MPGPAPKPPGLAVRRNNAKAGFTTLPAAGRTEPAPEWPLQPDPVMTAEIESLDDKIAALTAELAEEEDGRAKGRLRTQLDKAQMTVAVKRVQLEQATASELELWSEIWTTPQATTWDHFPRVVASYVRFQVRAEQGDLDAAKEARQLGDRIGMNPLALLRLRLEIERTDEAVSAGNTRRANRPGNGVGKPDDGDPRSVLTSY